MGLDGVEMVMQWEESFGITIADADAAALRTPRAATELICRQLGVEAGRKGVCLSQRAFYRLRRVLTRAHGYPRGSITPNRPVRDLASPNLRRLDWKALASAAGVPTLPKPLCHWLPGPGVTLGSLARFMVAEYPACLRDTGCAWTCQQVREVVRAVIVTQLGIPTFSDDADFVYDLRID